MSTKSSRVLHRTFLTCALFALLFVPQIGTTGTALAAKPKANSFHPDAVSNLYCLDLSLSAVLGSQTIAVANPPGQAVSFTFVISLFNNCGTTLRSGATVSATINTTCPANSTPQSSSPKPYKFPDPIVDQKSDQVDGTGYASCIVEINGVPTATILPASVTLTITGTGTDINGTLLQASSVTLPVT